MNENAKRNLQRRKRQAIRLSKREYFRKRRKPSMCQLLERIKWLKPVFVQRRAKQPRHFYACCYLETTRVFHLEVSIIQRRRSIACQSD